MKTLKQTVHVLIFHYLPSAIKKYRMWSALFLKKVACSFLFFGFYWTVENQSFRGFK